MASSRTPAHRRLSARTGLLALAAACGVTLTPSPAAAEPEQPTTSQQAAELVAARAHDLEVLTEQFNEARERLAATQAVGGTGRRAARRRPGRPDRGPRPRPGGGSQRVDGRPAGLAPGDPDQRIRRRPARPGRHAADHRRAQQRSPGWRGAGHGRRRPGEGRCRAARRRGSGAGRPRRHAEGRPRRTDRDLPGRVRPAERGGAEGVAGRGRAARAGAGRSGARPQQSGAQRTRRRDAGAPRAPERPPHARAHRRPPRHPRRRPRSAGAAPRRRPR